MTNCVAQNDSAVEDIAAVNALADRPGAESVMNLAAVLP